MIQHVLLAATENEIPQTLKESTMWTTTGHILDWKYDQDSLLLCYTNSYLKPSQAS